MIKKDIICQLLSTGCIETMPVKRDLSGYGTPEEVPAPDSPHRGIRELHHPLHLCADKASWGT